MRAIHWGVVFVVSLWLVACGQAQTPEMQGEPEGPRMLYFTQRTDGQPSLLAPGRLSAALGTQAVGEWGDLLMLHAAQPAQAILIDGAAVGQVNAEDLARLYRQCVVLAFFNLYSPEVARLVDDPSVRADGWMDGGEPYSGDFYIIVHRTVSGSQGDCTGAGPSGPLGATGGMGKSRSQYSLASEEDFAVFVGVLRTHLAQSQP
ncbi:MAG: hypothetical protein KIS88_07760 [Anaerolineales bacterium]|nr:hypothetical protein [Anaerolineales bacterium]